MLNKDIKNKREYKKALKRIDFLIDVSELYNKIPSKLWLEINILANNIIKYENKHYKFGE